MTQHPELLDHVPLYAFGVLPQAERVELETHLANGCAQCAAALRDARAVADALAAGGPRIEPSPRVLEALRARMRAGEDGRTRDARARGTNGAPGGRAPARRRARWWALPLAASLAALVVLGAYTRRLSLAGAEERARRAAVEQQLAELRAELETTRTAAGEASARGDELRELVQVLTAPDTRAIALAGQAPAPGARARAFLSPEAHQLLLFVYDLPPTPPGRTYQLWVIVEGRPPIPAGTFQIDADGRARHETLTPPDVSGPVTIAVTEEPEGGVPAPTGPIVLAGS